MSLSHLSGTNEFKIGKGLFILNKINSLFTLPYLSSLTFSIFCLSLSMDFFIHGRNCCQFVLEDPPKITPYTVIQIGDSTTKILKWPSFKFFKLLGLKVTPHVGPIFRKAPSFWFCPSFYVFSIIITILKKDLTSVSVKVFNQNRHTYSQRGFFSKYTYTYIRCSHVVRDFESEAKTRCNF